MRTPSILLLLFPACTSGYNLDGGKSADEDWGDTGGMGAPEDADADTDADDDGGSEDESDFLKLAPAATDAYVFVGNPDRDTVTRIAVATLAVKTTSVGDQPNIVYTTADYSRAVTFNEGSDDVSIIVADSDPLEVTTVAVRENFNRMSLSGDGEWVMCWYDPDAESAASSGGVQSFNEVSFVKLDTAEHFPMAVGFNPHSIRWTDDGARAVVVSDASLAVVDLTAATLSPTLVTLEEDALDAPAAEEVELSPDGRWAFVRQYGASDIVVVDLDQLLVDEVTVGDNPTDLDLSPDGTRVTVVSRGAGEIWSLDAADPFAAPEVVDFPSSNAYGSILYAGDGARAILYTNATALASYAVWDVGTDAIAERSLVKPVQTMGVSPTGESLLVFHTKSDASGADTESPFYGEWALTLIDLDDYRSNPMVLPAEPSAYTTSEDGRYGFFIMEERKYLEVLDFSTLLYDEVTLPSVPVHIGVLPGKVEVYASQEHDLGRMSFYDPEGDTLDTITGFELNSEIDHQ